MHVGVAVGRFRLTDTLMVAAGHEYREGRKWKPPLTRCLFTQTRHCMHVNAVSLVYIARTHGPNCWHCGLVVASRVYSVGEQQVPSIKCAACCSKLSIHVQLASLTASESHL